MRLASIVKKTKKKVIQKPKLESWRAELARIVHFLNKKDDQSQHLWNVLTALRGPDERPIGLSSEDIKIATTCVIRHKAGIEFGVGGCVVYPDKPENLLIRFKTYPAHFKGHARSAFSSLGLKWDEVNQEEK